MHDLNAQSNGESTAVSRSGGMPPPLPERRVAAPPPLPKRPGSLETSRAPLVMGIVLGVCVAAGIAAAVLIALPADHETAIAADGTGAGPSPTDSVEQAANAEEPRASQAAVEAEATENNPPETPADATESQPAAFDDAPVAARKPVLPLPAAEPAPPAAAPVAEPRRVSIVGAQTPVELLQVSVADPNSCQLTLVGGDVVLGRGRKFVVEPATADGEETAWHVLLKTANSIGPGRPIGRFHLEGDVLSFTWDSRAWLSRASAGLAYCLLQVAADGQQHECLLGNVHEARLEQWDLMNRTRLKLPLGSGIGPDAERVRLDLKLDGFPPHTMTQAEGLEPGELTVITLREPDQNGQPGPVFAELEAKFHAADGELEVWLDAFLYPKTVDADGNVEAERTRVTRSWLESAGKDYRQKTVALRKNERDTERTINRMRTRLVDLGGKIALLRLGSAFGSAAQLKRFEEERTGLESELLEQTKQENRLKKRQQVLEDFQEQWVPKIERLFEDMHRTGCLRLQAYLPVNGKKLELARIAAGACGE